jgi:hypothetical protein
MRKHKSQWLSVPGRQKAEGGKNPQVHLYLCTYNMRTLKDREREVEYELKQSRFKWDIIGLAEKRRKEE